MGKMVTGGEVYEAIRETCQRLYIAAGGDKNAIWTVKPYPETACIAVGRNGNFWHLGYAGDAGGDAIDDTRSGHVRRLWRA